MIAWVLHLVNRSLALAMEIEGGINNLLTLFLFSLTIQLCTQTDVFPLEAFTFRITILHLFQSYTRTVIC